MSVAAPWHPQRFNLMTVLVIQEVFRADDGLRKQTESGDGLKVQRSCSIKKAHKIHQECTAESLLLLSDLEK